MVTELDRSKRATPRFDREQRRDELADEPEPRDTRREAAVTLSEYTRRLLFSHQRALRYISNNVADPLTKANLLANLRALASAYLGDRTRVPEQLLTDFMAAAQGAGGNLPTDDPMDGAGGEPVPVTGGAVVVGAPGQNPVVPGGASGSGTPAVPSGSVTDPDDPMIVDPKPAETEAERLARVSREAPAMLQRAESAAEQAREHAQKAQDAVDAARATAAASVPPLTANERRLQAEIDRLNALHPVATVTTPGIASRLLGKPQHFTGNSDQLHVQDWLSSIRMYCAATRCPGVDRVMCAASYLSGDAATSWFGFTETEEWIDTVQGGDPEIQWDMFCQHLVQTYGGADRDLQASLSLRRLRQTGSIGDYIREFRLQVSRIKNMPLGEGEQIRRFLEGLNPRMRERCIARPDGTAWDSLSDLIAYSTRAEAVSSAVGTPENRGRGPLGVQQTVATKKVGNSRQPRGAPRRAPTAGNRTGASGTGTTGRGRGRKSLAQINQENPERTNLMAEGRCFKCHQPGHRSFECPLNAQDKGSDNKGKGKAAK